MTILTQSPIPGVKVLLQGESGSGKSFAARSLVSAGITPMVIATEPTLSILNDIPCTYLHYQYIKPFSQSFTDMIATADKINSLTMEMLTKVSDPNRSNHKQWMQLLNALHDYTCDRCGQHFGDVSLWGTDKCLYHDGLSGTNPMAMAFVAGDKPIKSQADWQMAQGQLLALIQKECTDLRCHFVLTAHNEREMDEISGGINITVSTLGKKIAPQIPRFFDEVIHCVRDGTNHYWSNITTNYALKSRLLPRQAKMQASFEPLIAAWQKQGGLMSP